MRVKVHSNLWYGDIEECHASDMDAVMHCCKNPCHAAKHGQKPDKNAPFYLCDGFQENGREHMLLNMIDPPAPLFQIEQFEKALRWAREQLVAGRKLMLHCNEGKSRAPSMAIVIAAHLLGIIPNGSYREAVIEFENQTGIEYQPGKGIQIFLKENWEKLTKTVQINRAMWDEPEEPAEEEEVPEEVTARLPETEAEIRAFTKENVLYHFSAFTKIENKKNEWIQPTPNALQFDIADAYTWCIENFVPCRLIILKPRQVGCSTFCGELTYHHMRRFQQNMFIMGDVTQRTEAVYNLFNRIEKHDAFSWDSLYKFDTKKGRFIYADKQIGKVKFGTANDPKAGISETRQVVWMTEAARYAKTGLRTDSNVITALLNSLANEPNTLGIAESTAEGAVGWFYGTYKGAVTLEERKSGKIGNGWIKVFAPWFDFPEHTIKRMVDTQDWFDGELNERERQGIAKFGWTAEQVAWRRRQIKQACNNDPRMFDQDFPEDAESCFLASGRPRFYQPGLIRLEEMAEKLHGLGRRGVLKRHKGKVIFEDAPEGEAWLWVAAGEEPTPGREYVGAVDPCTGEQNEGSMFPDAHAFGILRRGYEDDEKAWRNDCLAAVIDIENGCRWEDNMLAEHIKLVLDWYGDCMIVPETGNGLGVLNALQGREARIYRRKKHDLMNPGKVLDIAGWETNNDTRGLWVGAIADAIKDETIDVTYLPAVRECQTFYINDRGKPEAKQGCHDDWVTMLGLLLRCKEYADRLPPPRTDWGDSEGNGVGSGGGAGSGGPGLSGLGRMAVS